MKRRTIEHYEIARKLGVGGSGESRSFKDLKHYKRRKRWLA